MTHLSRETLVNWRNRPTDTLRAEVVPHLATCRACAAAYAELLRAEPDEAGPIHFNPAEFSARGLEVGRRALGGSSLFSGSSWSKAWRRVAFDSPAPVRWALAAQFALIVALGGALILSRSQEPSYTTLSGGSVATTGTRLTVVFQPEATAEAVRQALATVNGSIVSGPSAAGVFVVSLPLPADAAGVETSIETLRRNTGVIRFVEREP